MFLIAKRSLALQYTRIKLQRKVKNTRTTWVTMKNNGQVMRECTDGVSLSLHHLPPPPPHWAYAPDTADAGRKTGRDSGPYEWPGTASPCAHHTPDTPGWSMSS